MSRFVFDASAAFEYLARTAIGLKIDLLIQGSVPITAGLMDVEVISIARRNMRLKPLSPERASMVIDSLLVWPIKRVEGQTLVPVIWSLRNNFSAYNAFYVAVAAQTGSTLLTLDKKLSNAPKLPCSITVF